MTTSPSPSDGRRVDDVHVRTLQPLPRPVDLLEVCPTTTAIRDLVCETRASIARIMAGDDPRLVVVAGPCSVHDVSAALEYAKWIRGEREVYGDRLLIVMRVYLEKPRTRCGWKGFINDPYLNGTCRINEGLRLARSLLMEINAMGVPTATEFVDAITPQYIADLISWAAIGARTAESPVHRELASGLSCPVGFKNGTGGDVSVAVNAVIASRHPQYFLGVAKSGEAAIIGTSGNPNCHIVLRGGGQPNYDESSVAAAAALLAGEGLPPFLMVDCSHGNCQGNYRQQLLVAQDVMDQRTRGSRHIGGLMLESNLIAGRQVLVPGRRPESGQSITDPCLNIEETGLAFRTLARSNMFLRT